MRNLTPVEFLGSSLADLRRFPESVRQRAGYQLNLVQLGLNPDDWKPMTSVGAGVREIRVRDDHGVYRVMYVTKIGAALFVLHCFQKKTRRTGGADLEIARKRYKELQKGHSQ